MRLILAVLLGFTTVFCGFFSAWAVEKPDPKPLLFAINHCLKIAENLPKSVELISAYNHQLKPEDFLKQMDLEQKEMFVLYLKSRPDIPDFSFILPKFMERADRDQRIKFNSVMTLLVIEQLQLNSNEPPAFDNCKVTNSEGDRVSLKLQFGKSQRELIYVLNNQKNYGWYMEDLIMDHLSLKNSYSKELESTALKTGFDSAIQHLCKKSAFPTLKCE